jgi:hypothetical protein
MLDALAPQVLTAVKFATYQKVDPVPIKTPPWPTADSVLAYCDSSQLGNALCLSTKRLILGATSANRLGAQFMVGLYWHPWNAFIDDGRFLAEPRNLFGVVGYRLDVRSERFIRNTRPDTARSVGARPKGYTFRGSMYVTPNSIRLSEYVALAPYTIVNAGLSFLDGNGFAGVGGWGIGLEGTVHSHDVFVEVQRTVRGGGYASQWTWSLGWLAPLGK